MMTHEGYVGDVEYDDAAKLFHGEVVNTRDVITFQGRSVDELERAFQESIDEYLAWCEEEGLPPEKPFSGKFNLRLSPELHREVAIAAKRLRKSMNAFVEDAIKDELRAVKE